MSLQVGKSSERGGAQVALVKLPLPVRFTVTRQSPRSLINEGEQILDDS